MIPFSKLIVSDNSYESTSFSIIQVHRMPICNCKFPRSSRYRNNCTCTLQLCAFVRLLWFHSFVMAIKITFYFYIIIWDLFEVFIFKNNILFINVCVYKNDYSFRSFVVFALWWIHSTFESVIVKVSFEIIFF